MADGRLATFDGQINEIFPGRRFRVLLGSGYSLITYAAALYSHLVSDQARIAMIPNDLNKGGSLCRERRHAPLHALKRKRRYRVTAIYAQAVCAEDP